ncbi:CD244 protein, partial [Geococcyx californianus]|nr:CD244 protein [Geococcyx californianus]
SPNHGASSEAMSPHLTLSFLGCRECWPRAVSTDGELQLQLEKPPQGWARVQWKVKLDAGDLHRILTAERGKDPAFSKGPFSERAVFQQETFSLRISPLSRADSGVYIVEFEDESGRVNPLCFCVLVWEPIHPPHLETQALQWEQGWCNLSLVCTALGSGNISYSWSCSGDPLGTLEPQPQLHLQLHGDANPTVCSCNVSNPVSWSMASTDILSFSPSSPGLFSILPWWTVAVSLGLALVVSIALIVTCYWWRKRRKDPPGEHVEQSLTIYEEVGKARTGPTHVSASAVPGNTIYSTVQPTRKVRLPRCHPNPSAAAQKPLIAGCWVHHPAHALPLSAPQPPSLKKKKLDPALVSTAYVEVT